MRDTHALARTAALAAQVALVASGVWQQNMCCRIGGAPLVAGDEARLAKFDIVLTNNMFYQNIHNDTWSAIRKINPDTKVFACARTTASHHPAHRAARSTEPTFLQRRQFSRGCSRRPRHAGSRQ
jgi:hypothetical protein